MATSPYVATIESLIRRGVLSPAARDMPFADIIAQLEVADEIEAEELRQAWNQAGASHASHTPIPPYFGSGI